MREVGRIKGKLLFDDVSFFSFVTEFVTLELLFSLCVCVYIYNSYVLYKKNIQNH